MRVFTAEFNGYYPVGAVSFIVAEDKQRALEIINKKLKTLSFDMINIEDVIEQDVTKERVEILLDGNY